MAYGNNNYGNNGGGYAPRGGGRQGGGMYPPRNNSPRTQQKSDNEQNNGPTLFNERAGKFLSVNYWGRYASIEIGAVQPGSPMSWDTRKNAQRTTQVVPFENLSELWDICEEVIDSLKNTGTFTSAGVRVGMKQDAIVEINNGATINQAPGIYLVLYKNLDSSNRTNNLEIYPFEDVHIVRGYDHSTGMAKDDVAKIGQFKKFYRTVKEATKAFTMAQAHAVQAISRTERMACYKSLCTITSALGVDVNADLARIAGETKPSGQGGGNRGGQQGGFQNRNYGAPRSGGWSGQRQQSTFENGGGAGDSYKAQQQIMSTLDDPVDISLSMSDLTNVDMSQFK